MNIWYHRFSKQFYALGDITLKRFRVHGCLLLCLLFLLSGCQLSENNDDNLSKVDLWNLMMPESAIPTDWQLLKTKDEPIVSFGEENAAMLIFYYLDDSQKLTRGGVTLFQHRTLRSAARQYEKMAEAHFDPDDPKSSTPLFIPEGFQFTSNTADEWRFSCVGKEESFVPARDICIYLAQYDRYVVFFSITTTYQNNSTINTADLQQLIETIDERMMMRPQE